tara:strand:+ start:9949 stop:11292 length:1344 start_codon:yes stop_codon:yes gene_type:complete
MAADKALVDGAYASKKRGKVTGVRVKAESGEALDKALDKRKADKEAEDRVAARLKRRGDVMESEYNIKYGDSEPEEDSEVIETTFDAWKKDNPTGTLEQWRKITEKPKNTKAPGFKPVQGDLGNNSEQQDELNLERQQEEEEGVLLARDMQDIAAMYDEASDSPGVDQFYEQTIPVIKKIKEDIEPSKLKTLGVKALNSISVGVQQFKALKQRILDLNQGRSDGTGYSKGMDIADDNRYASIVSGKVPLTTRVENGKVELGLEENGKFTSMGDLSRSLDENQVDSKAQSSIIDIKKAQREIAKNSRLGDEFDIETVRGSVSDIVTGGNLKSIVHDKVFGRTSFATDLLGSNLNGMTYSELGIDSAYDLDGDKVLSANDNLSKRDQKIIMKELLNNPSNKEMLIETITDYLTMHLKENYNKVYNRKHAATEVNTPTVGTSRSAEDYLV